MAQRAVKIPQIVRWVIAGISEVRIAELLQMTPAGIRIILNSPEYKEYEAAYLNGHLSAMDRAMAGKIDVLRTEMRNAVPAALRCLVDSVTQRKDLKTALEAAKEILRRDPDRTLPESAEDSFIEPGIPAEVLDAAAREGNSLREAAKPDKVQ